jgi:Phosphatidylethanolamine-binding protein
MAEPFLPDSHATARIVSPALQWFDAPAQTKSFVLLCDDPDAPAGTWRLGPFITFLLIKLVSSKARAGRKAMTISSRPLTIFAGQDMAAHVHLIDTEFITTISASLPFHALTLRFTRNLLAKRLNEKRANTHWRKRLWLAYTNDGHGVELNPSQNIS